MKLTFELFNTGDIIPICDIAFIGGTCDSNTIGYEEYKIHFKTSAKPYLVREFDYRVNNQVSRERFIVDRSKLLEAWATYLKSKK